MSPPRRAPAGEPGRAMDLLLSVRSSLQLSADLPALVLGTVHVYIQLAGLERRLLLISQFRPGRHGPLAILTLLQGNDGRSRLPGGAHMNVRHRPLEPGGLDCSAHGLVLGNLDGAMTL